MRIGIVRLRSRTRYKQPLEHILDSYFYLLGRYILDNDNIEFKFYNITFDNTQPKRRPHEIIGCDHIIIPTEYEFHYQTKGYIHGVQKRKSDAHLRTLEEILPKNQNIILLTSDKGDNIDLFKDRVFKKEFNYSQIDESEFRYGVHSLKYHFIKETQPLTHDKTYDFVYWGQSKRKDINNNNTDDDRYEILNNIHNMDYKSFFIGKFDKFKRDIPFQPDFKRTLDYIYKAKTTLCFNWMNSKTHTSRYHEALACNVIPLTWKQYDEDKELVGNDIQICKTMDDVTNRLKLIEDDRYRLELLSDIKTKYEKNLPSKDEQYERFTTLLNRCY